eukprot:8054300-Lingulodinium_polyedra.AAC.1
MPWLVEVPSVHGVRGAAFEIHHERSIGADEHRDGAGAAGGPGGTSLVHGDVRGNDHRVAP